MKKSAWVRYFSLISQLGFTMITPILVCILIGSLLDIKFDKDPLFTIIFLLLGVGGAFRNLFFYVGKEMKRDQRDQKEGKK
ncbi:MAG: AtpZ/AtpI family protein [Cellulosilyticum sp.]|nr:AtpZ/AtpI family protein [Cellulosilyticum sp.]